MYSNFILLRVPSTSLLSFAPRTLCESIVNRYFSEGLGVRAVGCTVPSSPFMSFGDVAGVSVGWLGALSFLFSSSCRRFRFRDFGFIGGCVFCFWCSRPPGTRLYAGVRVRTPYPCLKANGFLFLETLEMGDDRRIGTGRPIAAPIRCSSHAIVM